MSDDRRSRPPKRPTTPAGTDRDRDQDPTFALVPDRAQDLLRRFTGSDELEEEAAEEVTMPPASDTPSEEEPEDVPETVALGPGRVSDLLRSFQITADVMAVPSEEEETRETGSHAAIDDVPQRQSRPRHPSPMETTTANFQPNLLNRYNYDEMDRVSTRLSPDTHRVDETGEDEGDTRTTGDTTGRRARGPAGGSDEYDASPDIWSREDTESRARPRAVRDSGDNRLADGGERRGEVPGGVLKRSRRHRNTEPGTPARVDPAIDALLRAYLDED